MIFQDELKRAFQNFKSDLSQRWQLFVAVIVMNFVGSMTAGLLGYILIWINGCFIPFVVVRALRSPAQEFTHELNTSLPLVVDLLLLFLRRMFLVVARTPWRVWPAIVEYASTDLYSGTLAFQKSRNQDPIDLSREILRGKELHYLACQIGYALVFSFIFLGAVKKAAPLWTGSIVLPIISAGLSIFWVYFQVEIIKSGEKDMEKVPLEAHLLTWKDDWEKVQILAKPACVGAAYVGFLGLILVGSIFGFFRILI